MNKLLLFATLFISLSLQAGDSFDYQYCLKNCDNERIWCFSSGTDDEPSDIATCEQYRIDCKKSCEGIERCDMLLPCYILIPQDHGQCIPVLG